MKTASLITCENLIEAYLIKGRLANEGIESFLINQNFTYLMPLYNNMLGSGIQIIVIENDYHNAREIITDKLKPNNKELICPYCNSNSIGLGLGKHKIFKIMNIVIAILAGIPFGNLKPKFYCQECKEEIK
jgi:hypothetical protein